MPPVDQWLYEYALVRFVPKPDRGECVNIGLVMMNKRLKWMKGKIQLLPRKILSLFPEADLINLEKQSKLFENIGLPSKDLPVEEKYRWLTAVKSAAIRVSQSHPGIIGEIQRQEKDPKEVMEEEFSRLFDLLVK